MVEGHPENLPVATSLSLLQKNCQVVARCLNPTEQSLTLKTGSTISTFPDVEAELIQDQHSEPVDSRSRINKHTLNIKSMMPMYLQPVFNTAKESCQGLQEVQMLAALLTWYSSIFSMGNGNVGKINLLEHRIPLIEGAQPVRLQPHRLGPEKEVKAERQVADLLFKGLIEPASGTWGSPVVLV